MILSDDDHGTQKISKQNVKVINFKDHDLMNEKEGMFSVCETKRKEKDVKELNGRSCAVQQMKSRKKKYKFNY